MTPRQPVRWMCLCESPGDVPPTVIPPDAHWIRLSDGDPVPAAPAAGETPLQAADELNSWPGAAPAAVQVPVPDYQAAVAARRGNTHAPD